MTPTLIAAVCKVIVTYGFDSPQVLGVLFNKATGWPGDSYAILQRQAEMASKRLG